MSVSEKEKRNEDKTWTINQLMMHPRRTIFFPICANRIRRTKISQTKFFKMRKQTYLSTKYYTVVGPGDAHHVLEEIGMLFQRITFQLQKRFHVSLQHSHISFRQGACGNGGDFGPSGTPSGQLRALRHIIRELRRGFPLRDSSEAISIFSSSTSSSAVATNKLLGM